MKIEAAVKILQGKSVKIKENLRRAEKENLQDLYQAAQRATAGPFSLKLLAKMGHPYAKRNPAPPDDPGIANFQTGRLNKGWRKVLGTWQGGQMVSRIHNVAPEATFFDENDSPSGTKRMIARPTQALLKRQGVKRRTERLKRAIEEALK